MNIDKKGILMFYGWSNNPSIKECAEKAYKDLARTMEYVKPNNKNDLAEFEMVKNEYKDKVYRLIKDRITELLKGNSTDFNSWHKATCSLIISESNQNKIIKNNGFHFGQAQKWLNMTFKNMLLVNEFLDEEIKHNLHDIEHDLHVPIDNIVLKVAKKDFGLSVGKKPWSKWEFEEYDKYQNELREAIRCNVHGKSPIEWEFTKWLDEKDKAVMTK